MSSTSINWIPNRTHFPRSSARHAPLVRCPLLVPSTPASPTAGDAPSAPLDLSLLRAGRRVPPLNYQVGRIGPPRSSASFPGGGDFSRLLSLLMLELASRVHPWAPPPIMADPETLPSPSASTDSSSPPPDAWAAEYRRLFPQWESMRDSSKVPICLTHLCSWDYFFLLYKLCYRVLFLVYEI